MGGGGQLEFLFFGGEFEIQGQIIRLLDCGGFLLILH